MTGYRDSLDENLDYEQQTAAAVSITAKYSVGELDVIIGSQESLQKLLALDYYLPLDEIFTEDELKTLLETANQRAKANGAPAGFVVTTGNRRGRNGVSRLPSLHALSGRMFDGGSVALRYGDSLYGCFFNDQEPGCRENVY